MRQRLLLLGGEVPQVMPLFVSALCNCVNEVRSPAQDRFFWFAFSHVALQSTCFSMDRAPAESGAALAFLFHRDWPVAAIERLASALLRCTIPPHTARSRVA